MLRKKPKTAKDLLRHSKKRAIERYNLYLTNNEVYEIRDLLVAGKGTYLGTESHSKTHWKLNYKGVELITVYDKNRRMVATFLDLNMANNNDYIDKNLLTNAG